MQLFRQVSLPIGQFLNEPRQRPFLMIERKLLEDMLALLGELFFQSAAKCGQQSARLIRVQPLEQFAVGAEVADNVLVSSESS